MDFEDKPVAEIILCAGFLLIYLIEECVHNFLDSGVHHVQTETVQVHRSFSIHSQACEMSDYKTFNFDAKQTTESSEEETSS